MAIEFETTTIKLPFHHPASEGEGVYRNIEGMALKGWLLKSKDSRGRNKTQLTFVRAKNIQYDLELTNERLPYIHPRSKNNRLKQTVKEMADAGWRFNGRTNHEGLLSVGAHTRLMFVRQKKLDKSQTATESNRSKAVQEADHAPSSLQNTALAQDRSNSLSISNAEYTERLAEIENKQNQANKKQLQLQDQHESFKTIQSRLEKRQRHLERKAKMKPHWFDRLISFPYHLIKFILTVSGMIGGVLFCLYMLSGTVDPTPIYDGFNYVVLLTNYAIQVGEQMLQEYINN